MKIIHTFGDSHASDRFSLWGRIHHPKIEFKCHHLPGKLMFSFGRDKLRALNIQHYGVKNGETVIFCFGEIDCRNHVHKHIRPDLTYQQIIDSTVDSYFNAIIENIRPYSQLQVCIYNVVPPHRYREEAPDHPYPFLGTDDERQSYYLYMNRKLKEMCKSHGFLFFDIYHSSCDSKGFLKEEYSDGNVHLIYTKDAIDFIEQNLFDSPIISTTDPSSNQQTPYFQIKY